MQEEDVEITADYYKQKAIKLLNSNFLKGEPIATYHKEKLNKYICEWFNMADYETDKTLQKYDTFSEDEEQLKEMFDNLLAPHLTNVKQALYCMRLTFEFVADQRILSREIFENIDKLRYSGLLMQLDGYPYRFDTREEAKTFFEAALMPYSETEEEKSAFWTWFDSEMVFDGEPSAKKIKQ